MKKKLASIAGVVMLVSVGLLIVVGNGVAGTGTSLKATPEEDWNNRADNHVSSNISLSSTTIYVPDDYAKIHWAVENATAGDTIIVRDGTYTENVNVNKRLTIRSENGSAYTIVQAASSNDYIFEVKADYVTISGFTVKGATAYSGIYLLHADYCTISNNDANSNRNGIELWDSNNNNTIANNNASNNSYYGISLRMSSNNTLTNNTMSGNKYNFGICCVSLSDYIQNIDPSNKVNGKPIYYLVNQQNQQIPDDAGFVGLINSTKIVVRDLLLTNNHDGVLLFYSNNSRIENVTVLDNNYGIRLYSSNNNTLTDNTANSNDYCGIYLSSSNNNTLTNNNASNNEDFGIALWYYSHNNFITDNIANSNKGSGISLSKSSNNTLINNTNDLNEYGIRLWDSSSCNTINNNIANSNKWGGIYIDGSNNTLRNNTASLNRFGMWIRGPNNTLRNNTISGSSEYNFDASGIQDIDTSNKINGKPIRYLVDEKGRIIDSNLDVGYLGIVKSRNITVRDLVLTNNLNGILLDHSNDSKIENVTVLNCEMGISLKSSFNNTISNNHALNNSGGIYLQNASDNSISNNNVSNNSIGIYLWAYSNNNTLTYNTVNFNSHYGIGFFNALNNNIYLNNFNNSKNVRPSGQTNTSWNSTSKITYTYNGNTYTNYMGNYWSDYNGSDIDNDGIGDTSYSIGLDQDCRPLMQPWENYFAPAPSVFDTGKGTYPSIMGTHNGTITPSYNITVNTLYTYACVGTGGHTESIELYENGIPIANGTWNGYQGDYHNITIHNLTGGVPYVSLLKDHKYNYTIRTGSYPQIHHTDNLEATSGAGTITCDKFIDANGKVYYDGIPAIKLFHEV
jgi:parallel beta-helix repeat protein